LGQAVLVDRPDDDFLQGVAVERQIDVRLEDGVWSRPELDVDGIECAEREC